MKRMLAILLAVFLLAGCNGANDELDRAITFRQTLLSSQGAEFKVEIAADYGSQVHTFHMDCSADSAGEMQFAVTEPETIAGISGKISDSGGQLTFDDTALAFQFLADGQISPVSAPWLLWQAMRGGYISACGKDDDLYRVAIDDSYQGQSLQVDLWLRGDNIPVRGEILWQGRRIMSVDVKAFTIL